MPEEQPSKFMNIPSFAELRHTPGVAITWRPQELARIADRVRDCRRCPGLNLDPPDVPKSTKSAPGRGDPLSPVVIVGQSLCGAKCIEAQMPFTGGSGRVLDAAFAAAGIEKSQIFITNMVHCHPPGNRASKPSEIANCSEYLAEELKIVYPRLIIGLGGDAQAWLVGWAAAQFDRFEHRERWDERAPEGERVLFLAQHPSWVQKRPTDERDAYVQALAASMQWAFAKGPYEVT